MADYYSILNKTISGLPNNTAETRRLVYTKARTAIDKQLRAITPPPEEAVIERQMNLLEAAIDRLESEHGGADGAEATAATPATGDPEPPVTGPVVTGPVETAAPAAPTPPPAEGAPEQPLPAPSTSPEASGTEASSAETSPTQTRGDTAPSASSMAHPPPAPSPGPQGGVSETANASGDALPAQPATRPSSDDPPAYDASLDALLDEGEGETAATPASDASAQEGEARGGRGGVLIALIVVAMIGVGGYMAWRNQDALMALVGLGGPASETAATVEEGGTQPAGSDDGGEPVAGGEETGAQADDESKEEARLGADGEEIAPEPRVVTPDAPTDGDVSQPGSTEENAAPGSDDAEPSVQPGSGQDTASAPDAGTAPQVSPVEELDTAGSNEATAGGEVAPAAVPGVAQTAYLYEEGTGSTAATRDNAAVIWRLTQEAPADDLPPEAVIRGTLEVPGRGLTLDLRIRRNVDESLPASHIIELVFDTPPDFSGGNVDTLARFVLKSSEQARGEPLIAVPARVTPGNFIIALNNLERARESNERLLTESNWIDIPLAYASGRRALVTMEKGAIGDRVFRDAFQDWQNR